MKLIQRGVIVVWAVLITLGSFVTCQGLHRPAMATITVHAKRFGFSPPEITLKLGQKTKIIFVSDDVRHGLSVTDLGISVDIRKGHLNEAVITPDKTGTFEGVCSRYCGADHDTMKLIINVTR